MATWPVFSYDALNHNSRMARARVAKFCMQAERIYEVLAL